MIAPLPPQTQPGLPSVDPTGAKPDPKGEGDAFAEILAAAAGAAARAPRLPGPPALEHGPAKAPVADLLAPDPVEAPPPAAGLTDPAAEPARPDRGDQPLPTARVFDQDGFFGASIDAPASPDAPGEPQPKRAALAQPERDPECGIRQADRALDPVQQAEPAEMVFASPASQIRPGAAPAIPPQPGASAQPRLLAIPVPRPPAAEAEAEPLQPLARRFAFREPPPRAAVQVAMRELEQGIHVAARAEGLDPAERVRLRDEISALLARHGLTANSIRISAPGRARTSQETLK